jgi:hypothetical protein
MLDNRLNNISLRKGLGYFLLVLSSLAYMALPVVPFLSMPLAEKTAWAGSLYLFSQVTWYSAIPLLGKDFIDLCKRIWNLFYGKLRAVLQRS